MDVGEDDLEYHVTFPSPTSDDEDEFESDEEGEAQKIPSVKEPVVFILGWVGSNDRHLAKYSALYERKRFFTIRYVPRVKDMYRADTRLVLRPVARRLLDLLYDLSLVGHPIIFHMFSNGGALVYRCISEELTFDQKISREVKGCIFDSGPAKITLSKAFKSITRATPGSWTWKYLTAFTVCAYLAVKGIVEYVLCNILKLNKRQLFRHGMWNDLVDENNRCPQLFIFSKADDLCDYRSIQEFMDRRKERQVDATSCLFDDSPHVDHLRKYPELYSSQIYSFVHKCLHK